MVDRHRVPGPGSYAVKGGIGNTNKGFSLTPRRDGRTRDTKDYPGPGGYELKSTIGEGPKYTATARKSSKTQNKGPGPGEYDQYDINAEKPPKWGFGMSQRPDPDGTSS